MKKNQTIPSSIQSAVWSVPVNKLDFKQDKVYIIHQVLAYGTLEQIKWLFSVYPRSEIRQIFVEHPQQIYTEPGFQFVRDQLLDLPNTLTDYDYLSSLHGGHPRRIPYQPLYPTVQTESLPIYDLRDLAADKAYTIGRRGQWRDYVDVFFLIQHGLSLASIVKDAAKKYAGEFGEKLFLEQLQYFDDLTITPTDSIQKECSPAKLKAVLNRLFKIISVLRGLRIDFFGQIWHTIV